MGPRMKADNCVLYVTSPGGVLHDVLAVADAWQRPERWVAVDAPHTREALAAREVRWSADLEPDQRPAVLAEFLRAVVDLTVRRPRWLVSAGTGLAVPWFLAARMLGVPTVWIETLNMRGETGTAAKICGRLARHVLVQHTSMLRAGSRTILVGELY